MGGEEHSRSKQLEAMPHVVPDAFNHWFPSSAL